MALDVYGGVPQEAQQRVDYASMAAEAEAENVRLMQVLAEAMLENAANMKRLTDAWGVEPEFNSKTDDWANAPVVR